MDNNEQSVDEVLIDTLGGYDPDSNAKMSQAELLAELMTPTENTNDPLGEF